MSVFDDLNPPTTARPRFDRWLPPDAVIAAMAKEGEATPTGWSPLDRRLRRGGIPPGRVVSVGGPPFSGKTTVVVDIALHVSQRIPVFALFSDEGRTQAAQRIGVMLGVPLQDIEQDPASASVRMTELLGERSITLLKPESEESNAEDVFNHVASLIPEGEPAMVILDSIQTIPPNGKDDSRSEREAYKEFMRVCRSKASGLGYIVLLTSQSNRASYRSRKSDENSVAIASFSGTAAIEFLSDVAIVLSLPDENSEIVKVEMVKNRLVGAVDKLPRTFSVRYSAQMGRMLEVDEAERVEANAEAVRAKLRPVSEAILKELKKGKELSGAELERRMRGRGSGFGTAGTRAALQQLESDQKITAVYREGKGGGNFYALRIS